MPINKSLFLNYLACPTMVWLQNRAPASERTPGEQLRMMEGQEIGERARKVIPNGILVSTVDLGQAAAQTRELLADPSVPAIFEATFLSDAYVTRADILVRDGATWKLIEVKSNLHDDKIDAGHIDDLAYTRMVMSFAGVESATMELWRISSEWRIGDSDEKLFVPAECSERVFERMAEFQNVAPTVAATINATQRPEPRFSKICKECDFYANQCLGRGIERPLFQVPRLDERKLLELNANNVRDVTEIPEDFPLTPKQRRVVDCIKKATIAIDQRALRELLSKLTWPCFYLDFESIKTALPMWKGARPHEQILTQYSLHRCDALRSEPVHLEYLAPHSCDSRRELAETLLERLGTQGSIVVYSSFEKGQLTALARIFPDLAPALLAIVDRLFDLERIFTEAVCHPAFEGRTSIKKTLPALVPEMSYSSLAIGNGDSAIVAFVRMARGLCNPSEIVATRDNLLTYCKQDTFAMVKLHRVVAELLHAAGSL